MGTKLSRPTVLLIAIAAVIFALVLGRAIFAVKDARKNRLAIRELAATSQELNRDKQEKIGMEDTVDGASAKAQQLQEALDKAAAKMTGDDAKAIRANGRFMEAMKGTLGKYESAYKAFISQGGIEAKTFGSEAAIEERLRLLIAFEAANATFAEFVNNADRDFRAELKKENYPEARIEEATRHFREGGNFSTLLAIRGTDAELCATMTKYLTLFKTEWGKWKMNEDGAILFQNDSAAEEFRNHSAQLQEIASRQNELQEKVLTAQQKKPTTKQSAVGSQ